MHVRRVKLTDYLMYVLALLSGVPQATYGHLLTDKPNIILIVVDDQGYGDLSCYPHLMDVDTPHIDSLAASGVKLLNGYATHHTCAPSRAALLSGRYQQRFGFYEIWEVQKGIPEHEHLLPEYLKAAGYRTALIGKWHLGEHKHNHPLAKGYDRFYGFLGGMHDYFNPRIGDSWQGGAKGFAPIVDQTEPVDTIQYLTVEFTDQAIRYIKQDMQRPFFLHLSYNAPHGELQAPETYIERYQQTPGKYRLIRAMNKVLDDQIGRLLRFLETNQLRENTLIIYISDNGGTRVNHNGALKGAKSWFWEGGIRVPYLVSYPAVLPRQQSYESPVSALDIFPTVLAAAGIPVPQDKALDGVNLLPFLCQRTKHEPHPVLFWSSDPYFDRWAIRSGEWKAIQDYPYGKQTGKPQRGLYNLREDISEENNLIEHYPEIFSQLESVYRQWIDGMPPSLVGDEEWTPNGNGWKYKYGH